MVVGTPRKGQCLNANNSEKPVIGLNNLKKYTAMGKITGIYGITYENKIYAVNNIKIIAQKLNLSYKQTNDDSIKLWIPDYGDQLEIDFPAKTVWNKKAKFNEEYGAYMGLSPITSDDELLLPF